MVTFTASAAGFRNSDANFLNTVESARADYYAATELSFRGYNFDPYQVRLHGTMVSTSPIYYPLDPNPDADGVQYEFHVTSVDYYDIWEKGNYDPSDDVVTYHGSLTGLDFNLVLDQYDNAGGPSIVNSVEARSYLGSLSFTVNGGVGNEDMVLASGRNYDPIWTFGENADVFNGNGGNDSFFANAGNDTLKGGNGDDFLRGGAGADAIYGGNDNDTLLGGWDGYYDFQNGGDVAASGPDLADRIYGGSGNDTLYGQDGNDTLNGESGSDLIYGEAGNDTMDGGTENDLLEGGTGNDRLSGGAGDDQLFGGLGNDTFGGGEGGDTFYDDGGVDTLSYLNATAGVAMTNNIYLYGTAGEALGDNCSTVIETIQGSNFADVLTGWVNADTFYGNGGDDLLIGGLANDRLDGGVGIDTVSYADAAGLIRANLAINSSSGAAGNDRLLNVENLVGSAYNDTLLGDAAANRLNGAGGNDNLTGAGGSDRFVLSLAKDTVADFASGSGGDVLDLSGLLGGRGLTENGAVIDDYLKVSASGSDTRLLVDLDGLGAFAAAEANTLLKGVTLFDATLTQAQILDNLFASGNLDLI